MESPRKFNDCYFYYYSTCTKGDNCVFRHEPSALGCETMCTLWQQGKCLDKRCKLRHMELRKNRKQIPCYWENQPGGCRKIHCPFMHKNPEARTDGIAPSQPAPPTHGQPLGLPENLPPEQPQLPGGVNPGLGGPQPMPTAVPAPVPMMWPPQRQVVLDSAILGVQLSASPDLRRVLTPHSHGHAHEPGPNPYAPLPVDPLVVNFEEESDNESAPSSTPTKTVSLDETQGIARTKSQELLLLERIQAESAAFYSYDPLPRVDVATERKIIRTNLSTKYDRLSLDEISGKNQAAGKRSSLDFKVLSLDEIRAKKKEPIIHTKPITVNLRKRKLSTQETMTTSGNKIIKVVRSNSIVYKKVDKGGGPVVPVQPKPEQKPAEEAQRKRTLSELSDIYAEIENELDDNCYEFKRVKITKQTSKPRLIRNTQANSNKTDDKAEINVNNDSDSEVQIISVNLDDVDTKLSDPEIIDVDSVEIGLPIDVVDLSDDLEGSDVTSTDFDLDLGKNVPDVVASCQQNYKNESADANLLNKIDALLDEEL